MDKKDYEMPIEKLIEKLTFQPVGDMYPHDFKYVTVKQCDYEAMQRAIAAKPKLQFSEPELMSIFEILDRAPVYTLQESDTVTRLRLKIYYELIPELRRR